MVPMVFMVMALLIRLKIDDQWLAELDDHVSTIFQAWWCWRSWLPCPGWLDSWINLFPTLGTPTGECTHFRRRNLQLVIVAHEPSPNAIAIVTVLLQPLGTPTIQDVAWASCWWKATAWRTGIRAPASSKKPFFAWWVEICSKRMLPIPAI